MLWTPQKGALKIISNTDLVGVTQPGTVVPPNGTTLLDGAVTELISAANNTQDSWGIQILSFGSGFAATASEATLDILIGGATDDVLIESLIVGYTVLSMGVREFFFPIHIPAGVRIAATHACVRTSNSHTVVVYLFGGSPPPFRVGRKVTTYGTKINNARGVAIVPSVSGAAASVTEIAAATAEDHFAFLPGFQAAADTTIAADGFVNIGIGVGASVEERIGTWWFSLSNSENVNGPTPSMPVFQDVQSGTRLTMLASNSRAANDNAFDGLIYAVS